MVFTSRGALVFQEIVSQIPPLLLGIRSGHAVLDMCASPGNKTRQLTERLGVHGGVVLAADVDPTRTAKLLGHALRRVSCPGSLALIAKGQDHPLLLEGIPVNGF